MDDKPLFAMRLDAVMQAQDVSKRELSQRLEVEETTVYRWLQGLIDPPVSRVEEIAAALDVPPAMLLAQDDDQFDAGRRSVIGAVRRQLDRLAGVDRSKGREPFGVHELRAVDGGEATGEAGDS